jgi:CDP-glucose 4,6-dehydratase
MEINPTFWQGREVLVTGHTGFKGGWLSLWLQLLGAKVVGLSIDPPTTPSLYKQAKIFDGMLSLHEDIRNGYAIKQIFKQYKPEIVFHLAAQPLVKYSYREPLETYETNVMGTLKILEGIRSIDTVRSAIMITTDKCYENNEWKWGYRENDKMGGHDPYSSSKAATEILISSYRKSFFPPNEYDQHRTSIASARAGNVIGGGDWANDRLIPDTIRAFQNRKKVNIRNPNSIRPWQHVIGLLTGYMILAERMTKYGSEFSQAWNFGPQDQDTRKVEWVVRKFSEYWGEGSSWAVDNNEHPHEANFLKLDCSKSHLQLDWWPKWNLSHSLKKVVEWHKAAEKNEDMRKICINQINEYMEEKKKIEN